LKLINATIQYNTVVQVRLFWRKPQIEDFLLGHASNREPDTINR